MSRKKENRAQRFSKIVPRSAPRWVLNMCSERCSRGPEKCPPPKSTKRKKPFPCYAFPRLLPHRCFSRASLLGSRLSIPSCSCLLVLFCVFRFSSVRSRHAPVKLSCIFLRPLKWFVHTVVHSLLFRFPKDVQGNGESCVLWNDVDDLQLILGSGVNVRIFVWWSGSVWEFLVLWNDGGSLWQQVAAVTKCWQGTSSLPILFASAIVRDGTCLWFKPFQIFRNTIILVTCPSWSCDSRNIFHG